MENAVDHREIQLKVSEEKLEKYIQGLLECSFDRRNRIDPPTREVVGTTNERFIVEKQELISLMSLIRQYSEIVGYPTQYPVPQQLSQVYDKCKAFYALVLSIDFQAKSMTRFTDGRFNKFGENLEDIADKLTKLIRFADTTREKMVALYKELGDPDVEAIIEPKPERPTYTPRAPRTTRPAEKKPKFNLAALINKNRNTEDE